jgi:outer membrane lipoprotein-sorting protein
MNPQSPAKNDHMTDDRTFWFRPQLGKVAICVIALACPATISSSEVASTEQGPASDNAAAPPGSTSSGIVTGSSPGPKPEQPATDAERLIDKAINEIAKLDFVAADLVQTVEMLNQNFTIKGHYLKAPGWRVYLRLTVDGAADTNVKSLQVCDGETLWDLQEVFDSRVFTRLKIKPILQRLAEPELDGKTKESTISQIGFAGTEALLSGLRKYYVFDAVDKEEKVVDGKAVWVLHGSWTRAPGLLAPEARPVGPQGILPAYIPGDATLYLGKADYWPYKLVLVGKQPAVPLDTRRRGVNGEPIGARSSIEKLEPTRIVLTYSDVRLNATISTDEFQAPTAAGAAADDRTELIMKGLDQALSAEVERKRREAARDEEPLQAQPIEIEIPPTAEPSAPR